MATGRWRLRGLNPTVQQWANLTLDWADYFNIPVRVTSGFRSLEEQARLRSRWEHGLSRFPANRPGDSAHNYGLAWDATVPAGDQELWNRIRDALGWNVPSNDVIHAEVGNWRELVGQ